MTRKKLTFEEALKALESIAEQIEQGQIGLEESIARYEQGMALVKHCREILTQAEHRIQLIQAQPDGTLVASSEKFSPTGVDIMPGQVAS